MRFALFGNCHQPKKSQHASHLFQLLQQREAEGYVDREFYLFLRENALPGLSVAGTIEDEDFEADMVICLGGDGTFLRAAEKVGAKGIPILGINTGRLGFLAAVAPEEMEAALDEIYRGDYDVEERITLELSGNGNLPAAGCTALNEIAILKRDSASMIGIHTSINGKYLTTYQADGLIVATPTGSTAYSLSNGGPIIVPQLRTMVLTAVAPHNLYTRPILIPDEWQLTLHIDSRNHNYLVAVDGRNYTCSDETVLDIRRGRHAIRIVKRRNQDFFKTLRKKLGWGAEQRI